MKTKMTTIWAGLALAGSLMAGSGTVSAAAIWQWDGTIGPGAGDTWAAGNGPGPWQIKDQGPTTGGGDGDALFTFDPDNSGPGANNPFGSIANVLVTIQEQEIDKIDYYFVEFAHAEGNEPGNGAVTNLYLGDHFAYTLDLIPNPLDPDQETISKIILTNHDLLDNLTATKDIYDQKGGTLLHTLQGDESWAYSGTSVYIVDTINNNTTTDVSNGFVIGVPEIDALAGTGALTLLGAALALAGERRRKHLPVTGELA